jgi:hypothetical protein
MIAAIRGTRIALTLGRRNRSRSLGRQSGGSDQRLERVVGRSEPGRNATVLPSCSAIRTRSRHYQSQAASPVAEFRQLKGTKPSCRPGIVHAGEDVRRRPAEFGHAVFKDVGLRVRLRIVRVKPKSKVRSDERN